MSAQLRSRLSMVAAMAIGLGYVGWLVWAEGWRLGVVIGVMALVGVIGGAVHLAMGLARRRDGLDAGDDPGEAEPSSMRDDAAEGEDER